VFHFMKKQKIQQMLQILNIKILKMETAHQLMLKIHIYSW